MKIVHVYMEHPVMELNNTFTYCLSDSQLIERGMRVKVDFNGQKIIGFVDSVEEIDSLEEYEKNIGYSLKEVEEIIDEQPLLNGELYQLGLWMSHQTVSPIISCFQSMLPSSLKPISSNAHIVTEKRVHIINREVFPENIYAQDLKIAQFKALSGEYRYNKSRKNGDIEIIEEEKKSEIEELKISDDPFPLTDQQKEALQLINECQQNSVLLHGLTGSGKTEIYLQLTKQAILKGEQVLILVPEISLTSQMIQRFKSRFNAIAVYHSGLSASEKYQQYQLVKQNKVKIVVGTRSAVFMPFEKIGLIVMDEEHDNSYKQDSSPRYHTRDVALWRANRHHCKLILGSATPTLESYARAIKGVYQLVSLTQRVHNTLPKATLVDMARESRQGNFIISKPLQMAIAKRLEVHQQVILLLNRRGYTPIMKCASCGEVITCPNCDIAMSYHKEENLLVCHCCGESMSADIVCPKCGQKKFRNYGVGTERLAEEVQKVFPQANILRMDADTTKVKDAHHTILTKFENHEADILIGTQMISKGLDYPDVTLVGIFNADAPLSHTDYRSVETTFDLIVQASGRSGRSENGGEVVIQAYDIDHYAIRLACMQDYIRFFNKEMEYRHAAKYPPYSYMIAVTFNCADKDKCKDKAFDAVEDFRRQDLKVLGPSPLLRKKNEYRYRIILKSTDKQQLLEKLWQWYNQQQIHKHTLSVNIDVDPTILD